MTSIERRMKELSKNQKYSGYIYGQPISKKKKKKSGKKPSQKMLYDLTLTNFQLHLYEMICIINGIDESKYLAVDAYTANMVRNMKIDKEFKKLSILDWKSPADINSPTFRGRFVTLLLYAMVRNCHRTVRKLVIETYPDDRHYKNFNKVLNNLIETVDTFITAFLSADLHYEWSLQGLLAIFSLASGMDAELIAKFEEVREGLKSNISDRNFDSGIKVNNVMKLAFALATGSTNVKKTPQYIEEFPINDGGLKASQTGELGYAICKRWQKTSTRNALYEIFIEANPRIYSAIVSVNENPEVAVGVQALEFLKLCVDDYETSKFIDKLMIA